MTDGTIEVNPGQNQRVPKLDLPTDTGSPRRKAMKCTLPIAINIEYLHKVKQQVLHPKKDIMPLEKAMDVMKLFVLKGKVQTFTEKIFDNDAPFYQNEHKTDFKLWVTLIDSTGQMGATMFRAARAFTLSDVETMMGLWESCDTKEGREVFLEKLNAHAEEEMSYVCSAKVWAPSGDMDKKFEVVVQDVISPESSSS